MYDNPIVSPHIKPGPILWVNCQVVTMHLNHGDDYNYSKDHDVNVRRITSVTCAMVMITILPKITMMLRNGTSFPRVLGSLLTKEARLITEEGTIRT